MSFLTEENQFCKAFCETVNGEWERSMQRRLSDSEANLGTMRERRDTLQHNCSLLVRRMRDTVICSDRYKLLQNRLEKKREALESRRRERNAKARFNGMSLEERLVLARRMAGQGIAIATCNRYIKAVEDHERQGHVKKKPGSRRKEAQREVFQRSGYAEGRKIEAE